MATYGPVDLYKLVHAETVRNQGTATIMQEIMIVSIIIAESGGNTMALNDRNNTPAGSRDRGLYQFNDHWNPDVTDVIAYDPVKATEAAYRKSNGWKSLDPLWTNSKGRASDNVQSVAGKIADAGVVPVGDLTDVIEDKVEGVIDSVTPDWMDSLGELFANLLSPTWWKRLGIGVTGIAIIIIALIVIFADDVADQITPGK